MPIQIFSEINSSLSLPQRTDSYIVLAAYVLLALAVFALSLSTFRGLGGRRWLLLAVLLLANIPLNAALLLPSPSIVLAPALLQADTLPLTPLLGWLCMLLAGAWLGVGPAMAVGLAGGAGRWLLAGGRFTLPFEMALISALAAFLMQQDYHGWLARTARQPLAAGLIAGLAAVSSLVLSMFASAPGGALAAVDYTLTLFRFAALPALGASALSGLLAQLASLAFPTMRRTFTGTGTPFYARSFGRRLLFTILPITFITITFQVVVVGLTALDEANRQTVAQLSRDARSAAELLDSFFLEGQGVLVQFAQDSRLREGDVEAKQAYLNTALHAVAFFDELLLVEGLDSQPIPAHLAQVGSAAQPELTDEESARLPRTLREGAPQRTGVFTDENGHATISFIQPISEDGQTRGALVGRTRLRSNPRIGVLRRSLPDSQELGRGYLVDDKGVIVIHPDDASELSQWVFDRSQPVFDTTADGGKAYIDLDPDGVRRLVFVHDVSGAPWKVAIELPYANILGTAAQISMPLLAMFAVIMAGALVLLPYVSRRITQPLGRLAQEAGRMTKGELDLPVPAMGEDEVGQLSVEFERMRQSLKARVDDLSLLLRVSESVAASLDLDRGIPPILEGAMRVTSQHSQSNAARTARLIALDDAGKPTRVVACGDGPTALTPLDEALAATTIRDERPLQIENVARSRGAIDPDLVGPGVRSVVALPLRRTSRALGVMWLGYPEPRPFAESELGLLVTLAGQAAVFLENAGLFEAAEGGRQRLQAVLSSTIDAVLVTDRENRILLCNPAAEIAFGISPGGAVGKSAGEVIADQMVLDLLTERGDPVVRTAEVLMPDGRTLYGSAASIASTDGVRIGRVAVLRDITHLKELDSMKSEFVATVSHDLRSPLTYMRGYLTMIPMVGQVASKQQEYLDKIMSGIEQMTTLIDDLLDLGRIEAGVGIVRESARLADIARDAVESMGAQAHMRKMTLQLEESAPGPLQGDKQLIKHAMTNLIDNAIKYSPEGGWVRIGVDERDGFAIVKVSDNGIGIATADQPRLFEKFYRVKRRDTIDIRGTGLGLAIVKSIAEWHNGRVWVESQLGQGSTFYVALPMER